MVPHRDRPFLLISVKGFSHWQGPSAQLNMDRHGVQDTGRNWPLSYQQLLGKRGLGPGKTESEIVS